MAGWPVISLGTSSIEDSARISVSNDNHKCDSVSEQVMSFMGGKNLRRNYGKTRAAVASVATERFQILLDQAKKMAWTDERLSRRYVTLARKISSRTKVRIPRESKMYLCKGCGLALVPGIMRRYDYTRIRLEL